MTPEKPKERRNLYPDVKAKYMSKLKSDSKFNSKIKMTSEEKGSDIIS